MYADFENDRYGRPEWTWENVQQALYRSGAELRLHLKDGTVLDASELWEGIADRVQASYGFRKTGPRRRVILPCVLGLCQEFVQATRRLY